MNDGFLGEAIHAQAIDLADAHPGDLVAAHSRGIIGWLIRFGTHSRWNHIAVVTVVGPTPETTEVVQAEAHGVEVAKLSDVAPGGYMAILPCPPAVERARVVAAARDLLREKYAFVSIVSIAFGILARLVHWPLRFAVRRTSTLICSAVGALALLAGGWTTALRFPDLYQVTPADLALALTTEPAH